MKVTELSHSFKATVQMRQFEPVEISGYIRAQVDPSDKPKQVMENLKDIVHDAVDKEVKRKKRERMDSVSDDESLEKTI